MSEGLLTVPWIICIWPGLSRLWQRGDWLGLLGAGLFTVLFNFALATSFVWPSLVTPTFRSALWLILFGVWSLSFVWTWRNRSLKNHRRDELPSEDLFLSAQGEYLKGNWYQTQTILEKILQENPRDVEARLMLLTMFRHTGRQEEAKVELQRIKKLELAEKWSLEIHKEEELLERDFVEENSNSEQSTIESHPKIESHQGNYDAA